MPGLRHLAAVEDLGSAVLASVTSSLFGSWLGHLAAQNPDSPDPLHSRPCRGRWTPAAALQRLYSWMDIFFLAGADMVELDRGGAIVAELDSNGAVVAPSKPSRSVGSSQSTGVGEGKSAIGDSVLSCCR